MAWWNVSPMAKRSRAVHAAGVIGGWIYVLGAVLGVYGVGGASALRVCGVVLLAYGRGAR